LVRLYLLEKPGHFLTLVVVTNGMKFIDRARCCVAAVSSGEKMLCRTQRLIFPLCEVVRRTFMERLQTPSIQPTSY
jgi:hypothetical protein